MNDQYSYFHSGVVGGQHPTRQIDLWAKHRSYTLNTQNFVCVPTEIVGTRVKIEHFLDRL